MKRKFIATFIIMALLLTGCASTTDSPYVQIGDVELTVDTSLSQVTDGQHVYGYTMEHDRITVAYPNGMNYTRTYSDTGLKFDIAFGSGDGDISGYLEPDTLFEAIEIRTGGVELLNKPEPKDDGVLIMLRIFIGLLGAVEVALGLWRVIAPESSWHMRNSWRFRDAEPSDLALTMERVGGVVLIILGVLIIIGAIFGLF